MPRFMFKLYGVFGAGVLIVFAFTGLLTNVWHFYVLLCSAFMNCAASCMIILTIGR